MGRRRASAFGAGLSRLAGDQLQKDHHEDHHRDIEDQDLRMFLQPFMNSWVIVTCILLGVFSLGIYPIMLELSVECTYPLDESVVTGLCYLSSAIQGSVLMFTENLFNSHLETEEELSIQTCSSHHLEDEVQIASCEIEHCYIKSSFQSEGGMEAKNFTNYLIYINTYMIVLILTYFFFFNTELKRSKVK